MRLSLTDYLFYALQLLGVLLILACFVSEAEEKHLQSGVERLWITLDDKQLASRARIAAYMQEVARLTGLGFDKVFGKSLFSLRFIFVSIYLSLASFFLFTIVTFGRTPVTSRVDTRLSNLHDFVFFVALALIPAVFNGNTWWEKIIRVLWWMIIPVAILSVSGFIGFVYKRMGAASTFRGGFGFLIPFAASFVVDLSYIVITRWILRLIPKVDHLSAIILMIVGNLLFLMIPILGPLYFSFWVSKYELRLGAYIFISILLNSVDVLAGFAGLVVGLLLLLHRLFWPVIERPLYAIHRYAPLQNKKWLFRAGIALVVLPRHITFQVLKLLLEKLS